MKASNPRGLAVIAAAAIDDDGYQWIEVMPTAEKARNGRWYFTITSDDLATYAASIQANAGLIPVDYDHEGADGGSTVAAGWFEGATEIVAAGGGNPAGDTQEHESLWAKVKWTPQAAQEIRDGRFKRISPEHTFAEKDSKTGLLSKAKEIIAATLTNRPFFTELSPVGAADVVWDADTGYVQRMTEINEALNGDSYPYRYWVMDVGDGKALVCEGDEYWVVPFTVNADGEAEVGPLSDWMPAEQQWVSAPAEAMKRFGEMVAAASASFPGGAGLKTNLGGEAAPNEGDQMDSKEIRAALGLPEDADDAAVLAAVAAAKQKADKATALDEERKRLKSKGTTNGGTVQNDDLIAALGLADDADEAELLAAVRTAKAGADRLEQLETENDSMKGVAEKNRALEGRLKTIEAERRSEKIQRILADGVRSGKVFPAEKASLAKQFATNPDGLAEIIDARPDHAFSLTGSGSGDQEDGDDIISVKTEFASEEADGVDTDSARLHVRAMQVLREQGKRNPTEAEYLDALEAVGATR